MAGDNIGIGINDCGRLAHRIQGFSVELDDVLKPVITTDYFASNVIRSIVEDFSIPFHSITASKLEPRLKTAEVIQLATLSGSLCTMKLRGTIGEHEVVTLIDSGATHNFISKEFVRKLQLSISETDAYGVNLANGSSVEGAGVCRGVNLQLQGIIITGDFLPMELGSDDVILGIQWLETLGTTRINWKTKNMEFCIGDETVTLRGDPSISRSLQSSKAVMKTNGRAAYRCQVVDPTVRLEKKATYEDIRASIKDESDGNLMAKTQA